MAELPPLDLPDDPPRLAANITHFARALRAAGLPVGPGKVIKAVRAVAAVGFTDQRDFYWALHAVFVTRPEQRRVFAQVFRLFWRDPRYVEHMMAMMLPAVRGGVQEDRAPKPAEKRAAEALLDGGATRDAPDLPEGEGGTEIEVDATLTMSREERLRTLDFEQMSTEDMAEAKRLLARLRLPVKPLLSRRTMPIHVGGPNRTGGAPCAPRCARGG